VFRVLKTDMFMNNEMNRIEIAKNVGFMVFTNLRTVIRIAENIFHNFFWFTKPMFF